MGWLKRRKASRVNDLGIRTEERGMHDEAEALYRKAAELAPDWSDPWFNFEGMQSGSGSAQSEKFTRILEPRIAATALGDWGNARLAWKSHGVKIPDGAGPLQMQLGPVP